MPPLHWYNYPVQCFMQITNARTRIIYSTYYRVLETNILDNITLYTTTFATFATFKASQRTPHFNLQSRF